MSSNHHLEDIRREAAEEKKAYRDLLDSMFEDSHAAVSTTRLCVCVNGSKENILRPDQNRHLHFEYDNLSGASLGHEAQPNNQFRPVERILAMNPKMGDQIKTWARVRGGLSEERTLSDVIRMKNREDPDRCWCADFAEIGRISDHFHSE